ncbi:NPL4 family-domain-containing protein [Hyaloraphidium curvatum]|nr:NPL4 family-domain-containing protein [Hyaloraphidium curvatum]
MVVDTPSAGTGSTYPSLPGAAAVEEDALDRELEKKDGLIKRNRDPRFCRHGEQGMCDYCRPLEPYDPRYLEQHKIKHLSFHAYLRQLMSQNKTSANKGFVPPLEVPDFKIKKNCPTGHPPYPEGICTKCQPSAYTLQQQEFRQVDHLEFESPAIIETLLSFWRSSGLQRFGYMYGRYEAYSEVALGVKAVVSAIYEPPQEGAVDGIQLVLPDPQEKEVEEMAAACGLRRVGMIYTDLEDDGAGKGTVVVKRHADSFFLSSGEITFAAQMQLRHPMPSKYASEGSFGSRFVTAVVTGNTEREIDIFPYQVSNVCMAMERDGIIEASTKPSVMLVKEATSTQYVPELFYKLKNEYGAVVKMPAKPAFPVEYLLVTLTHGFPQTPSPTFVSRNAFPIENRGGLGTQDLGAVKKQLDSGKLTETISDFHLLVYLGTLGILAKAGTPRRRDLKIAAKVAVSHSEAEANALVQTDSWQTLLTIMASQEPGPAAGSASGGGGRAGGASGGAKSRWQCRHCTFENSGNAEECSMCGLPR